MEILANDPTPTDPALTLPLLHLLLSLKPPKRVRVTPDLPSNMLQVAARQSLMLSPGEVVLAIVGRSDSIPASVDCVLTNLGVHYLHKKVEGTGDGFNPALRGNLLPYAAIPEATRAKGVLVPRIDFNKETGKIPFSTGSAVGKFVLSYLVAARSLVTGQTPPAPISEEEAQALRTRLVAAHASAEKTRMQQAEARAFAVRFVSTQKTIVTPIIVAACSVVFVWMALTGVSPVNPTIDGLLEWGANFGPAVLIDHEYYRIFTCMFLHIGFFHILMNMVALASSGPVVERIFGHFGFAALYLLSGIGGSLASLWYHPLLVSAGASGAIFGVFGGLIGILIARRREIPLSVLQPTAKGLAAFLGYNLIFGLAIPNIDMAAHIGGLVTGVVCGLALALATKTGPSIRPLAKGVAVAGLTALLAVLAVKGAPIRAASIKASPEYAKAMAAPLFNKFTTGVNPAIQLFDTIQTERQKLLANDEITPKQVPALESLAARSATLPAIIEGAPAESTELQAMKASLLRVVKLQKQSLDLLIAYGKKPQEALIDGPSGLMVIYKAMEKDLTEFTSLRQQYIQRHELRPAGK